MNDTVTLNGKPEPIDGDIVQRFITDVAKIWEKLIDLDLVKARWGSTIGLGQTSPAMSGWSRPSKRK